MDDTQNINSSLMPMNTISSANLLNRSSVDLDDMEEDETENIIIKRVITSKMTNPTQELNVTPVDELVYELIRFDASFSSDRTNYNWVIYKTPKEVKKHVRSMYEKIANREFNTQMPIHPVIIQLRTDKEVVSNLSIITDFYNKCFAEPNIQNNQFLTNFFNIGGTSFFKMNAGNKPFEGWAEKRVGWPE